MLTDEDVRKLQQVIVVPLEKRMVSVENKVDNLTDRVESVENKVDNLSSDVSELKINVNAIHVIVSEDRDEFGKRIERLEKHVGINP